MPATPKLYNAPVVDDPVPVLYVVRVEYQPGIVELSVHAMTVPVIASVSKFSVNGTPSVVILPPLVNAYEDGTSRELCKATPIVVTAMNKVKGRMGAVTSGRGASNILVSPLHFLGFRNLN